MRKYSEICKNEGFDPNAGFIGDVWYGYQNGKVYTGSSKSEVSECKFVEVVEDREAKLAFYSEKNRLKKICNDIWEQELSYEFKPGTWSDRKFKALVARSLSDYGNYDDAADYVEEFIEIYRELHHL